MLNNTAHIEMVPTEIERGVIGALIEDGTAIDQVIDVLRTDGMFGSYVFRTVYAAILELFRSGIDVDIRTVSDRLLKDGKLEDVGGTSALVSMANERCYSPHLVSHAKLISEWSIRRRLAAMSKGVYESCTEKATPIEDVIDFVQTEVFDATDTSTGAKLEHNSGLVPDTLELVQAYQDGRVNENMLKTGFADLDSRIHGLSPGEMIVIAGRTSHGKTQLALQIAQHVSIHQKRPVAFLSLEMTKGELMLRLICSEAMVDSEVVRRGDLTDPDWDSLSRAGNRMTDAPLYISDESYVTPMTLRALIRRARLRDKIELLVVDYLQLMAPGNRFETREQAVSYMSRSMKILAKELNIPVIVLSQLRRLPPGAAEKEPCLSDLRESGAIEQDADKVVFVYSHPDTGEKKLIVSKYRNGSLGSISMAFVDGRWAEPVKQALVGGV